ncbi:unnamed protein product [Spirodela intermedia]|uniref:Uncharacterized protein n=1 Tax=Spirodela intermedia TaxID=51605 RepID=A0A7I8KCI1_SPIIN|nr:unnamed protein product [Spirodela intermedia]
MSSIIFIQGFLNMNSSFDTCTQYKFSLSMFNSFVTMDLSSIEPGSTVTVKWRGKPVFIRRRTAEDISVANAVDLASLRDPQEDAARMTDPEWLIVVGVCTHLGCIQCRGLWGLVLPVPRLTL